MLNNKNIILLSAITASSFLVGCEKNKDNNEVVKEQTVIENNKDSVDKDLSGEIVNENKEVANKGEETVKEDTVKENDKKEDNKKEELKDKNNATSSNTDKNPSSQNTANNTSQNMTDSSSQKTENKTEEKPKEDNIVLVSNPVFTKSEITDSLKARMTGKSMKENDSISFDDLSYLTITYLDYNGKTQQGEMVVHKKLADEVLDIFKEIYYAKFPIERMNLIDDYNAVDHTSMVNNNSSAFCYRTIAGTNKVSKHGLGVAIDINPFYNPHVLKSSGKVNPPEASKYANRSLNAKGMIKKNDAVYKAFTSRGWTWGGNWNNPDYQHFEKSI